jgi:RNA recognition motif-containing protein
VFIASLLAIYLLFLLPTKIPADHTLEELFSLKLFFGNLSYDITEPEESELFDGYGEVVETNRITDHCAVNLQSFVFVQTTAHGEGHKIMETLKKKRYKHIDPVCEEAIFQ